jgi:DNA segregation ATPase FtsK/SpoIIIE-like protein
MEMEQAKKNKQSKKEAKCNAKPPKPKKRKINIENFPISDDILEKANQIGGKEPKEKETLPSHKPKESETASKITEKQRSSNPSTPSKPPKLSKLLTPPVRIPNWLFALLLILALSILGLGLNALTKSSIPLWLLLGFSIIYSIEKWFNYFTRRSKILGKLYRLTLNLGILSTFGLLIWSGFQLVAKQLASTPLTSSSVFLAELVFFIWIWRKVAKNSWRWPSMKLTISLLICVAIIFTFAGVPPLSTYKDNLVIKWEEHQAEQEAQQAEIEAEIEAEQQRQQAELERAEAERLKAKEEAEAQKAEAARQEQLQAEQAQKEAEEEAARIANLRNPSWTELKAFLLKDDTDKMEYVYPVVVCADFADNMQENAEEAGWRCAVVWLDMVGYTDPYNYGIAHDAGHACNAFETTDRGLVYIDCTRAQSGPFHQDCIVEVQVGKQYNPEFIFPSGGWYTVPGQMGTVVGVDIRW